MDVWKTGLRAFLSVAVAACLLSCGGSDPASDLEVQAQPKAEATAFTGNGFYWNPDAPGTGMFFEAQGSTGVLTIYAYETTGVAVWYMATGQLVPADGGGHSFSGSLLRYSGGQTANSKVPKLPLSMAVGSVTMVIRGDEATGTARGGAFKVTRFFKPGTGTAATRIQPETGIYWNADENGRGYVMEVHNGTAMIGVFHYADTGQPVWHLVVAPLDGNGTGKGRFASYTGGQTVPGPWRAATLDERTVQDFTLKFQQACQGEVVFPGMWWLAVKRFAFGSLPAGRECRDAAPTVTPGATYFPGVSLSLSSPTVIAGEPIVGGKPLGQFEFAIAGDGESIRAKPKYFVLEDPDRLFASQPSTVSGNATRLVAQYAGQPLARTGRYQGTLKIYACLDLDCKTPLAGSPMSLPYDFTVRPGVALSPASPVVLDFKPSDEFITVPVTVTVPAGGASALAITSTVAWQAPGHVTRTGVVEVPSSAGPQQVQLLLPVRQSSGGTIRLQVGAATPVGGAFEPVQVSQASLQIQTNLLTSLDTNLSALAPLPGAGGWNTYMGSAARTGYVNANLDAQRFNRRFVRSQGGGAVVADGGLACRTVYPTGGAAIQCLSEQTGEPVWESPVRNHQSPSLYGGKLYTTGKNDYVMTESLWVLDAATGNQLAKHDLNSANTGASPAVVGSTVYTTVMSDPLVSVDLASGVVTRTQGLGGFGNWYPAIADGKVYAMLGSKLYEIENLSAGTHRTIANPGSSATGGYVGGAVALDGAAVYGVAVNGFNRHMTRFDRVQGTAAWSVKAEFMSNPVPVGNTVYVLTTTALEARSAATGAVLWAWTPPYPTIEDSTMYWSRPLVVVGKHAFLSTMSGTRAIDLQTRQQVWYDPAYGHLAVTPNGTLLIAGGQKFVAVNLR